MRRGVSTLKSSIGSIAGAAGAILRSTFVDLNPDPAVTIFLAGTGRSGSSWVANILNYRNDYRYMFEPFYGSRVPECRAFQYRQYLRPADDSRTYLDAARAIVTGKIRNRWIDQFNRRPVSRRRIIKDIRANLLLKWLKSKFPAMPLVIVMRNPCADAASRLALGWRSHLEELLAQPDLVEDHLAPFLSVIRAASTDFERHVVLWCIENYVPLKQFAAADVHLAFYENFCTQPETEIGLLFGFIGRTFDAEALAQAREPTALSREESAIVRGGSLIDSWRETVSDEQRHRALEIVAAFGLEPIYGNGSLPSRVSARALFGGASV